MDSSDGYFLVDADNETLAIQHAMERSRAAACLRYLRPDDGSILRRQLQAMIVNTDLRGRMFLAADSQLGGQELPLSSGQKEQCTFDPDTLPN